MRSGDAGDAKLLEARNVGVSSPKNFEKVFIACNRRLTRADRPLAAAYANEDQRRAAAVGAAVARRRAAHREAAKLAATSAVAAIV